MKIAITGATGFVGSQLTQSLSAVADVMVLGRHNTLEAENYLYLDLNDCTKNPLNLQGVDVVIHLAARVHVMNDGASDPWQEYYQVNTAATLDLAKQAVESGVKRFIFISSIKVNGESTVKGKPFTACDERLPEDDYGRSKSEAETQLLQLADETGMEVVIIRPPLVYGPGVKANFSALMKLVMKGLPLPFASINTNKRSLVSVTNLVDLIVTCIDHPKAVNQLFLVSDDHDVSTSEMVKLMAKSLNVGTFQWPFPLSGYRLLGKVTGKSDAIDRLIGSLQVDITQTKERLDWTPPISIEEGFKRTANAIKKNNHQEQNHD